MFALYAKAAQPLTQVVAYLVQVFTLIQRRSAQKLQPNPNTGRFVICMHMHIHLFKICKSSIGHIGTGNVSTSKLMQFSIRF